MITRFADSPVDEPIWLTEQLGDFAYNEVEFSKSIVDDDENYYYDEWGIRRKKKVRELTDIDVEEISMVDFPATRKKFSIIKGDDITMEEDVRKKITEEEIKILRQSISILDKAEVTGDLKTAKETLEKYFKGTKPYPYPYPVKKSNFKWSKNTQRTLLGYSDSDLEEIEEEDLEIEKSSADNPFPSLTRIFNQNSQNVEEIIESENIESRFC